MYKFNMIPFLKKQLFFNVQADSQIHPEEKTSKNKHENSKTEA